MVSTILMRQDVASKTTLTSYPTHIDIPEQTRTQVVEILNQTLADTIDLKMQFKQAHWNVKGMNFYQLHQLFDEIAIQLEAYIDLVAERVTALGLVAIGTARTVAQKSNIREYSLKTVAGQDHVAELADRLAFYGKTVRGAIAKTSNLGDLVTADIYTEISRTVDKYLWLLEAHLQQHCLFEG